MKRLGWLLAASAFAADAPVDFQREIRPILSDNCFACHGPDSTTRMAGLRLDLKDAALDARKTGAAIVPGSSDRSALFQRVTATGAKKMPPAYSHKVLTPKQIATLKRWIDQGAPWKEHWAFQTPAKPKLPVVKNAAWAASPIDRFVLAALDAKKLTPAPVAERRTLIRRVALDLTGLPPKPEEVIAFVADTKPGAYERMVDRYLASPRYGEHRARYWLDAARYADTHGIHVDNYREMWPYRDWVINAFNKNMPFDQFTLEQLAGDLLPNPTLEQLVATGFHRNNATTNEAGLIEDEYAEIYAKDRADTTGAVWLGMTVGCATCHDHKFDPISQKDFYALGAFFRNTTQKVMDDNIPDTPPVIVVPSEKDRPRWTEIQAGLAKIRQDMTGARATADARFSAWLASMTRQADPTPLERRDEVFEADWKRLSNGLQHVHLADSNVAGFPAMYFDKAEGVKSSDVPHLDADKPFSISVNFLFPKAEESYEIAGRRDTKDKNRGWVMGVGARVANFLMWGDKGESIEVRAGHLSQIKHGTWNHLVVTYDGSRHQSGLGMFLNGRAIPTQGRGNQNLVLKGTIANQEPLTFGRTLKDGAISDFRIFNRVLTEAEANLLSRWPEVSVSLADPAKANRDALLTYYLVRHDDEFRKLGAQQNELNLEARAIARRSSVTHVMNEQTGQMPFAHVLYRGAYDQKRDRVEANTPAVLPPMTSDLPRNRLGFAKWLMRPDNPVTARVTVNRMWQEIFGTGLVKTPDDFGSQGEPPTHPELLDWLAIDFREGGWDIKRFYRQVLLSNTYRQSALATPAKLAADPDNRYFSRGPRFRMDAEMVRDYALSASGLLAPPIGGPSARPYQPEGVWEAVAMVGSNTRFYKQDGGENLYRRSLYTFWKRSAPPPSMDVFNAPTRESCTVRRERTNTPLQALVTMNDVQFVEAARQLAERVLRGAETLDARLDYLSTQLLARPLSTQEREVARRAYQDFARHYDSNPEDAKKLIEMGDSTPDRSLDKAQFAAMTMLANQFFNLDEVLTK